MTEHFAWCPVCFDALDGIELRDEKEMITGHIYSCFGCEKHFELKEFDLGERAFGKRQTQSSDKENGSEE